LKSDKWYMVTTSPAPTTKGMGYDEFFEGLLMETGVSVCTRLHFGSEMPGETQRYLRMAYSGIDLDQIEEGLGKMKAWVEG
jgi:aspartate/methionine/tyrosine aminotransferase